MNEGLPWTQEFINRFKDRLKFGKTEPISSYESTMGFGIRDLRSYPWSIDFLEKYEHKWNFEDFNPNEDIWNKAFKPYVNQEIIDLIFRILS